jgi:hypothetical protein
MASASNTGLAKVEQIEWRCRYCGCTEERACVFDRNGIPCSCWWVNREHTACSAPGCFKRYLEDLRTSAGADKKRSAVRLGNRRAA